MSDNLVVRKLSLHELRVENDVWMAHYLKGDYDRIGVSFLEILNCLGSGEKIIARVDQGLQAFIDRFCSSMGFFFSQPLFQLSESILLKFLYMNSTISNLFSLSRYQKTDVFLHQILATRNNLSKVLVFYNARCKVLIPYDKIFAAEKNLSGLISTWYGIFLSDTIALTGGMQGNFSYHLRHPPKNIVLSRGSLSGYFNSTYINTNLDRNYKSLFNKSVRKSVKVDVVASEDRVKPVIAIASGAWFANSAVYRSISPYIESISKKYSLSLINTNDVLSPEDVDVAFFDDVFHIKLDSKGNIDFSLIQRNNFSMLIYADVGMDIVGRIMSNIRIAPHQVAMYGHPVSTWGSEVDFFIGGREVEIDNRENDNYSETLVPIQGLGAIPVKNSYFPENKAGCFKDKRVAFLGSFYKINNQVVESLSSLLSSLRHKEIKALFMFFPGLAAQRNMSYAVLAKSLKERLGDETVINVSLSSRDYIDCLNQASICLDSYPFGGFNTIMDALHLGKPVVTWEGEKAYNRLASAVLRRLGLEELIATSQDEYIQIAERLLSDECFYNKIVDHIKSLDIDGLLYAREEELEDFASKVGMILDGKIKHEK